MTGNSLKHQKWPSHRGPVKVTEIPAADIVSEIAGEGERAPRLFTALNAHGLALALDDARYRRILNESHLCFCDGFGIHLLYRVAGIGHLRERNTPTDFLPLLLERLASEGKRIYLLGDTNDVASAFAAWVEARHPGLVAGWHSGFFSLGSVEEEAIIAEINRLRPHAVFVGMGNPRQEFWAAAQAPRLACRALVMIGASMAFLAGKRRRGPRWATDHGLEGLFRVLYEPGKLARRYLVELPTLAWRLWRRPGG